MIRWARVLVAIAALCCGTQAWALVYCSITDVKAEVLSNGTQITVAADGVLDYMNAEGTGSMRYFRGKTLRLLFPGARSKVERNFIDVSKYPVSSVQVSVAPSAKEGIGILISVNAMTETEFEITRAADRQSVIITVKSSRTLEAAAVAKGEQTTSEKTLTVSSHDGLGTIHAVNAEVHEVFARLARELGIDIAVDDGVERKVSIYLTDMPAETLLRSVARAAGLALVRTDDGTFMVGEGVVQDLATYRLTETRSFRLNNIQASEAAQLLPSFIFPYIHQNAPQNAVVVTAQEDMLKKIEADLTTIDVAPPQIMIEVLAVEFQNTRDAERSLGITFTNAGNDASYDASLGDLGYSTIGLLPADFSTTLRWMESKGKAVIRAQPRMAVLNGHWGRIFIGTTRFMEVEVTQYGTATKRIQGVNVGVTLGIRPWTGSGKEITTFISSRVSSIAELDPKTGLPVLSTRDASTQIRTKDGETIVIGGLTLEQEQVTNQKTPILGDIPLIGKLFRRRSTQRTTSELVIFVTPRMLDNTGRLPDAAEEQDMRERFLEADSEWQAPRTIRISPEDLRAGKWRRSGAQ